MAAKKEAAAVKEVKETVAKEPKEVKVLKEELENAKAEIASLKEAEAKRKCECAERKHNHKIATTVEAIGAGVVGVVSLVFAVLCFVIYGTGNGGDVAWNGWIITTTLFGAIIFTALTVIVAALTGVAYYYRKK